MDCVEEASLQEKKKKGFDYKWIIVALSVMTIFTVLGFCSSSNGVYLDAITNSLNMDRALFSLANSIRFIATAVVNIFFGFLISRFGVRKLLAAGYICLMISMSCYALADNIFVFYLGGFFLGLGLAWTTTTMVGFIVGKWFKKNRGTIMGFILASNGIGGAVAIGLLGPIIGNGEGASAFGYRKAYWIIVAILFVVGLICVLLYKENKQVEEVDEPSRGKKKRGRTWVGLEFSEVKKKKYFYTACVCIFFTGFVLHAVNGVSNAHISGILGKELANTISIVHLIVLTCSKFLAGFFYDKKGLRFAATICSFAAVISMLLLGFVSDSSMGVVLAVAFGAISSISLPLETIMLPIYAGDLFGEKAYSKVLGIFVSVNVAGYALGSPVANLCYEMTGSYVGALFGSAAIMLVVVFAIQFIITKANKERERVESEIAQNG